MESWRAALLGTLVAGSLVAPTDRADGQCNTDYLNDLVQPAATTSDDWFGAQIAVSGSRMAVGAPIAHGYNGLVYVFDKGPSGWSQSAVLTAPGVNQFGSAISIEGDLIVASSSSPSAQTVVFELSSGTWTPTLTIQHPWPTPAHAIDEGRILFGEFGNTSTPAGSAYLYEKVGGAWSVTHTFSPNHGLSAGDFFGGHVDLEDDKAVIGSATGIYVFEASGTSWVQTAKIATPKEQNGLAIDKARIYLTHKGPSTSQFDSPIVIFDKLGSFWVQTGSIFDPETGGSLGTFVVHDGVVLAGGSPEIYRIVEQDGAWIATHEYEGSSLGVGKNGTFVSLAMNADEVYLGAYDQQVETGAVGVYRTDNALPNPEYGQGCPGTAGFVPTIRISGLSGAFGEPKPELFWDACFLPGANLEFVIKDGLGGSAALLLMGSSPANSSLGGTCTLLVGGTTIAQPLPLLGAGPGQGEVTLYLSIPQTAGPGSVFMQAWVIDPGSAVGASSTDAIRITTM